MSSRLHPAQNAKPASWLQDRIGLDTSLWVVDTVGAGFTAYARVFHPLGDEPSAPRWADVAALHQRVMHPSAEWDHISRPPGTVIPDRPTGRGYPGEPVYGNLEPVCLEPLCDLLAQHTTTPDHCWFGIWTGWAWLGPPSATATGDAVLPGVQTPIDMGPSERLAVEAPRFSLPMREYLLYEGAVRDALRVASLEHQSPSLFWPDDHAWCVATEIDFDTTLVGGSQRLVDALERSPQIDALQIDSEAPFGDRINT